MRRPASRYALTFFSLLMLMMCWEYQKTDAALAEAGIPEQAVRLRILANSDHPQDQWIKRKVRDALSQYIREWALQPTDIEQARREVRARIGDIERIVGEVLERYGYAKDYTVSFGPTPFPPKWFNNRMYPEGEYEALLVTLGKGKGRNWWCVLFPPLCFVDMSVGVGDGGAGAGDHAKSGTNPHADADASADGDSVEIRFFLVDLLESLIEWLKGLFQ